MKLPGKMLVHPEIGGGAAFRQIGEVEAVMTNRPKRLVGEAAIILDLLHNLMAVGVLCCRWRR